MASFYSFSLSLPHPPLSVCLCAPFVSSLAPGKAVDLKMRKSSLSPSPYLSSILMASLFICLYRMILKDEAKRKFSLSSLVSGPV